MKKRWQSILFACQGLRNGFLTQPNFRIHLAVAIAVIVFGWMLSLSRMEWIVITLTIALVLSSEMLNTAMEYLTNLVSPDYHPLAGKAKDAAAAAVLLTAAAAVLVGLIIFLPKLLQLFN
jgi:diacylglycerol kinase